MLYDLCDCPLAVTSADTVRDWNAMVRAFLAHGTQTPVHLAAALAREPQFAMGHAARGLFSLMMGRAELIDVAREALGAAQLATKVTPVSAREALWITALLQWLNGSPRGAINAMEDVLTLHPGDSLSAKVSHAIRFALGDSSGMRRSVETVLAAHGADHPLRGYLLGCHAFALEETGDYHAAERVGLEGLSLAADDAWGLHAVAHVHDMTAQPERGIAVIENHTSTWDHCNNFRYHVWWHKALLHLDRGEMDVALGLYDAQIRADKTDDYRDIANATSLLIRLEHEGIDIGARWEELADLSENRVEDGCLVFADLHYMLALSGADRPAARARMSARFARTTAPRSAMPQGTAHPGQAAIAGLNAFAEGRYDHAFRRLVAARPAMSAIGGSHAQRDVFERMTIDAGLRAGHFEATEAILQDRIALRAGYHDRFAVTRLQSLARARQIPAE